MKKSVPFELFGPNQFIMFDIVRLAELEKAMGHTIIDIAQRQDVGVNFCLTALPIGMKQHFRPDKAFYAEKIEEYLDNGGVLDDISIPLVKAIAASGIFGKAASSDVDEALSDQQNEVTPKNVKKRAEK